MLQKQLESVGIHMVSSTLEHYSAPKNKFDVVLSSQVLTSHPAHAKIAAAERVAFLPVRLYRYLSTSASPTLLSATEPSPLFAVRAGWSLR